jgi:hypothetical protein
VNSGGVFSSPFYSLSTHKPEGPDGPPASYRSATDGVPQNDHAVAEPALVDQLQLHPHTIREESFSGANDHWTDDHLKLVDETSP